MIEEQGDLELVEGNLDAGQIFRRATNCDVDITIANCTGLDQPADLARQPCHLVLRAGSLNQPHVRLMAGCCYGQGGRRGKAANE